MTAFREGSINEDCVFFHPTAEARVALKPRLFVFRAKKLSKQIDRLQAQILEEKSRARELSAQLTEAADYKACLLTVFITLLEMIRGLVSELNIKLHKVYET